MGPGRRVIPASGGLFVLAVFLWAWLSMPLPQVITLHHVHQHFRSVPISLYPGTVTYYERLIWGALLCSFVGPALIWLIPKRFVRVPPAWLWLGLVVGLVSSIVAVRVASPADARGLAHPIDPVYFVGASVLAGLIAGYLKMAAVDRAGDQAYFSPNRRFLVEGTTFWLALVQILACFEMADQTKPAYMGPIQLYIAIPALFWAVLCSRLVWKRRPRRRISSILLAIGIGFGVSKIAGILLVLYGMFGHPRAIASWIVIGIIILPRPEFTFREHALAFLFVGALTLGPSLLWGFIMGLRRWQYLQSDKDRPAHATASICDNPMA